MMKTGIIELMMWTVLPVAMRIPMVQITETMATIMAERMREIFLKNTSMMMKMMSMAMGAEIAICLNISTPNVSSATGSPVMW